MQPRSDSVGTGTAYGDRAMATVLPAGTMFIDPHVHMIARTTDGYEAMITAGVVAAPAAGRSAIYVDRRWLGGVYVCARTGEWIAQGM